MPINITGFNHIPKGTDLANRLNHHTIVAGAPVKNDKLNMVMLVQETGKHIEAKNYPFLVIPTGNAAGRKTSEIAGLYQRGHALGIDDASQPNGFRIMFVLRKSVDIPARPFMRITIQNKADSWKRLFNDCYYKAVLDDEKNYTEQWIYETVGKQMVKDLQETIDKLANPADAPLTAERKGFNNPLIDTKVMRDQITWFVVNK